jgi:REP element-mobilizing transposase RayT
MPQSYTALYYHLVFATKHREPTISPDIRERLYDYLGGIVRNEGGILMAIGGMPDHVHLLVRLRQLPSLADVLRVVKTNSSKWSHEAHGTRVWWQDGYGAFTVGQSSLADVKAYIAGQEEHHKDETFLSEFPRLLAEHGVEFNEKYLWE